MLKGTHHTEIAKEKLRRALQGRSTGRPSWNKGLSLGPRSEEIKDKIRKTHLLNGKNKARRYNLICSFCGCSFVSKASNAKACPNCLKGICAYCGKEFKLSSRELEGDKNNPPRKYCSQKCYHAATKGKVPWNKDYVSVKCQVCGKEFSVPRGRKDTVKYCSLKCKYDGQSQVTGVSHPLWKGGYDFYSYMLSQNKGSFYRNRGKVLERDQHTCRYCGFKGASNYMDVHHIIPVREGGANTMENMITLCRKCHNRADRALIPRDILLGMTTGSASVKGKEV